MIKVLIVEDSPLVCKILTKVLESDPELKVVGVAKTGRDGVGLTFKLKPDIITMDIVMPDMDGVEATKQIMAYQPTPILILTASHRRKRDNVFQAISFGALDVVEKIGFEQGEVGADIQSLLITKIKLLSRIKVIRHPLAKLEKTSVSCVYPVSEKIRKDTALDKTIVIAASTGGPQALLTILSRIPENFPCAILVVQHIAEGFTGSLATWLSDSCSIKIKLAEDNDKIKPATVYIVPSNVQMRITEEGIIQLTEEPPEGYFKPSANVLFSSVAKVYKSKAIGIVLTGMGKDGASGIKAIKEADGKTIAQDEKTSIIFGMPQEAINTGMIDKILPIGKIADEIMNSL